MKLSTASSKTLSVVPFVAAISLLISACGNRKEKIVKNEEQHWAAISAVGAGSLYLDEIPANTVVHDMDPGKANTVFLSYRVGFTDSLHAGIAGKTDLEKGKYFQYDMYKDWVALIDGDSVRPVFYQPMVKKQQQREEGILVFEIPKNRQIDTLVYNDSFGPWGQQVIINSKY